MLPPDIKDLILFYVLAKYLWVQGIVWVVKLALDLRWLANAKFLYHLHKPVWLFKYSKNFTLIKCEILNSILFRRDNSLVFWPVELFSCNCFFFKLLSHFSIMENVASQQRSNGFVFDLICSISFPFPTNKNKKLKLNSD